MKASELFMRCLEAEGVEYVFGVAGEENADFMISLQESPIRFVSCHHEQGAAFMADLYGRITGRPGVCLSTLGPGATNLVTGVANANLDHSPLVAITGQGATTRLHKESHQNVDVVQMFTPLTKWAMSIRDERTIPEVVRKAFKVAIAEKPGASHIELPEDIAKQDVDESPIVPPVKVRRPIPDAKAIRSALDVLGQADRPVLLVGHGCVRTRVTKQLHRFVDETGIYAASTLMAKGALSDRHPRSLYAAGIGSRDYSTEVFEAADLVVAVGYDMVEWHPSRWNVGRSKKIIHIDFEPAEVDGAYRPTAEVVGDIAAALWAINESLGAEHRYDDIDEHRRVREQLSAEIYDEYADDDSFPMKPQRLCADLRAVMGDDDIVISDVGAHKMWVARHYPAYAPNSCIISNGFCAMGIALPGAVSAKLVKPDRRVVGAVGDGAFLMNLQELATAARLGVAPVYVIWEDGGYGLITWKQELEFARHFGTDFTNPDFVRVVEGFGCHAQRIGATGEFREALLEAFERTDRPSVIVVPVDYSENLKLSRRLGQVIAR